VAEETAGKRRHRNDGGREAHGSKAAHQCHPEREPGRDKSLDGIEGKVDGKLCAMCGVRGLPTVAQSAKVGAECGAGCEVPQSATASYRLPATTYRLIWDLGFVIIVDSCPR
jgi:hypothetical protein